MVWGKIHTEADEFYSGHNIKQLNVKKTIKKLFTIDYIQKVFTGRKKESK